MRTQTRRHSEHPARQRRQNTQLEAAGAEFLVLGRLLIAGIAAFKSYTNFKGYDPIATNVERMKAVRLQVKSRWRAGAEGFIINRIDCDFVVVVLLNRGSRDGTAEVLPPEFFVIPAKVVRALPRTQKWGKMSFSKFPDRASYRGRWDLIRSSLRLDSGVERRPTKSAPEVTQW
jgi:hypothetical protein